MSEEVTLQQLLNGDLVASSSRARIKDLEHLPPMAVQSLRSVELLDVSGGHLHEFPSNFSELHCLKILFASNNNFSRSPSLHSLPCLAMIAFRSNRMAELSSACFPRQLRWLILTDNMIQQVPDEIGGSIMLLRRIVLNPGIRIVPFATEADAVRQPPQLSAPIAVVVH
jgi:Leucine-rich repeat (LRR) protein